MLNGLDQIKYVNHLGESFGTDGYKLFMPTSEIRNYEWAYSTNDSGNYIKSLKRKVIEKSLTFVIYNSDLKESNKAKNNFYEIVSKDNVAQQMGKIYLSTYYLEGYVIASKKSDYYKDRRFLKLEISFLTDGVWRKLYPVTIKGFQYNNVADWGQDVSPTVATQEFLDYPYDYPHDFYNDYEDTYIVNANYLESDFKLTIYAPAINPRIVIDGHVYEVFSRTVLGEKIVIDSKEKTIVKIDKEGNEENIFNLRNKESDIFQKIPSGKSFAILSKDYMIDLWVYEERSEPSW
jgi:hypothetical protein